MAVTPLEAARALQKRGEPVDWSGTFHGDIRVYEDCGGQIREGHASDCPWLQLPAIIKILEAAEGTS